MENNYRTIVSRIQNDFNSLSKDTFIPRRYILSIFKAKAEHYLLQKLNEKKLFGSQDMFEWLNCIKLKKINPSTCGISGLSKCKKLMVSEKKLPDIINTDYGYAIMMATNIDHSKTYTLKSFKSLSTLKDNKFYNLFKGKYFYIIDGYLYFPDSDIKMINLLTLTLDEKADECQECNDSKDNCVNYWDKKLKLPKKYLDLVIRETLAEISTRLQIPKDEYPNLNSNAKTETVQ